MATNEAIPFYRPGEDITVKAEGAITGGRFVNISGDRTSGPGLSDTAEGSNYVASTASAAGQAVGVSNYDIADQALGTISSEGVLPIIADGNLSAGDKVEVGADGKATVFGSGEVVGIAMTGALNDETAEIMLRLGA